MMFHCRIVAVLAVLSFSDAIRTSSRFSALSKTWEKQLESSRDTPVTRVVKLLEGMAQQMKHDMEEDEDLHKKLSCWCNDNEYEKKNAIEAAKDKIEELQSTIEKNTARSAELKIEIKKTEEDVAEDKQALAEATALRTKEAKAFHGSELDDVQALENLKAALTVLAKHSETESTNWHEALAQLNAVSFVQVKEFDSPRSSRELDEFMSTNDYALSGTAVNEAAPVAELAQTTATQAAGDVWSDLDIAVLRRGLSSGNSFAQASQGSSYSPSYESSSGEIVGILKQMHDEMAKDLLEDQKEETERAKSFEELRSAKSASIAAGEKRAEKKEDELASTDMDLAEAKEDLVQTTATLEADQKFMGNLEKTCKEADENFALRKKARLQEMQAVSETIEILTKDEARDAMSSTFKEEDAPTFVQVSARSGSRAKAAALLRRVAASTQSTELAALASTVELNAFEKVKLAIDDMIKNLKIEQEDEVKKHDWCKEEIQKTEMATMKTQDQKADIEASIADLDAKLKSLADESEKAQDEVSALHSGLQQGSVDRQKENLDFQKTIEDQTLTIEVLHKALDRLATFYDKEEFLQLGQTPPVPQAEFTKNAGAGGVMSMIEKLIYEAKDLMKDARNSEVQAQSAYEDLVADTNASVAALQKKIMANKKAAGRARKEKRSDETDLMNTVDELERLNKYDTDMHHECDYLLKNFDTRQTARAQEVEALQQAKQILSGASLA